MMKLDYLIDRLQPYFLGLSEENILREINNVSRTFCQKSSVWKDYSDVINQRSGDKYLDVDFGKGIEVFRIIEVILGGKRLTHLTDKDAIEYDTEFFGENSRVGETFGFVTISSDKPVLVPAPTADSTIRVYASLRPSKKDGVMPEEILTEYEDVIFAGVMANLLRIPVMPWYDKGVNDAIYYSRKFISGVEKAGGAIGGSNTPYGETVNLRKFSF